MKLTISSVDSVVFSGEAYSVECPGTAGVFTVLSHHEPLVASLTMGELRVRASKESAPQTFPIQEGVIEVQHNEAIVLL